MKFGQRCGGVCKKLRGGNVTALLDGDIGEVARKRSRKHGEVGARGNVEFESQEASILLVEQASLSN